MTIINDRIKDLRFERGKERISQEDLAKALDIPNSTISDYEIPGRNVPHEVVLKYCDYFNVTSDYLLGRTEIRNIPHVDVHELHLTEEAMDKLKARKVNGKFLSDLIEHSEFDALMLDMDIYVKGFLDEGLQYVNSIMKKAREKLSDMELSSYDGNRDMKTFSDINVSQDLYFAHAMYERLNIMLHDIREARRKDYDTSDVTSEDIDKQLEDLVTALSETTEAPSSSVAAALRSGIMLSIKIKQTPQNIAVIDEFVKNLKIDAASMKRITKMSVVAEPDGRKKRKAAAKNREEGKSKKKS